MINNIGSNLYIEPGNANNYAFKSMTLRIFQQIVIILHP